MIIVSQDRDVIVSFENIVYIKDFKYDEKHEIHYCDVNGGIRKIGEYKTRARAKEVLQAILDEYGNAEEMISSGEFARTYKSKVYYMPKE